MAMLFGAPAFPFMSLVLLLLQPLPLVFEYFILILDTTEVIPVVPLCHFL